MSLLIHIYPGDSRAILIANVLVQVTVVVLMARLLARLGNRWNAACRYSIYVVALLCVLASPLLACLVQATGIALVTVRPPVTNASSTEPAIIPMADIAEPRPIERPTASQATPSPVRREVKNLQQNPPPDIPAASVFPHLLRALGGGAVTI
jgi:hypothetical protein